MTTVQTQEEKIVINQGTNSENTGLSTPVNQIDIDSEDAITAFEQAFAKASSSNKEQVKSVTPPVLPDEPIEKEQKTAVVEAVPDKVKEDTTSVVKEDKKEKEDTKPTDNDPYGWVKALPEEIQAKVTKEINDRLYHEQKYRSDIGRQSALQNKILKLERALAERAPVQNKPQDTLAATAKQEQAKTLQEWNALIEADPSLAKAIDARIAAEREQNNLEIQKVKQAIDPLYQRSYEDASERERQLLAEKVPNYLEVISSPVYKQWLDTEAAPGLQKLAMESSDHRDAITVLQAYAAQAESVYNRMVSTGQLPAVAATQKQEQAPAANVEDTKLADKVAQSRQAKIQNAPVAQQAHNHLAANSDVSNTWKTPGAQVDLDDGTAEALFLEAFKNVKNRR